MTNRVSTRRSCRCAFLLAMVMGGATASPFTLGEPLVENTSPFFPPISWEEFALDFQLMRFSLTLEEHEPL